MKAVRCLLGLVVFAAVCGFTPYGTNDLVNLTVPLTQVDPNDGSTLQYRIFVPAIPETATNGVPLVLFLHGSGECLSLIHI